MLKYRDLRIVSVLASENFLTSDEAKRIMYDKELIDKSVLKLR